MSHTVQIEGAVEAERHMRNMGERAVQQRPVFERAGRDARRHIKGVPVDTGRLAASVTGSEGYVDAWDGGFAVRTRVPYARFVLRGTSTMPATPPQLPPNLASDTGQRMLDDLEAHR
jgi:hypothetical protein